MAYDYNYLSVVTKTPTCCHEDPNVNVTEKSIKKNPIRAARRAANRQHSRARVSRVEAKRLHLHDDDGPVSRSPPVAPPRSDSRPHRPRPSAHHSLGHFPHPTHPPRRRDSPTVPRARDHTTALHATRDYTTRYTAARADYWPDNAPQIRGNTPRGARQLFSSQVLAPAKANTSLHGHDSAPRRPSRPLSTSSPSPRTPQRAPARQPARCRAVSIFYPSSCCCCCCCYLPRDFSSSYYSSSRLSLARSPRDFSTPHAARELGIDLVGGGREREREERWRGMVWTGRAWRRPRPGRWARSSAPPCSTRSTPARPSSRPSSRRSRARTSTGKQLSQRLLSLSLSLSLPLFAMWWIADPLVRSLLGRSPGSRSRGRRPVGIGIWLLLIQCLGWSWCTGPIDVDNLALAADVVIFA